MEKNSHIVFQAWGSWTSKIQRIERRRRADGETFTKNTSKVVRNEACGNIWLTCLGGRRLEEVREDKKA